MITDALGRSFDTDTLRRRVISLVPSLTETLFDLGAGETVVGITDFCLFPPDLKLPLVGGTKNPSIDAIRKLKPDLVHMNLEENLERHAREIEQFAPVFVSEPKTVIDVAALIATLGALHGTPEAAARLVRELEETRTDKAPGFSFACAIWKQPWMWAGGDTYVSGLIEDSGGRNVFASDRRYPTLDLAQAIARKPDIVFLPDEPYAFTVDEAKEVSSAGARRVVGPFPGHLVTWHGSRTIQGLRFVHEAVRIAFEERE